MAARVKRSTLQKVKHPAVPRTAPAASAALYNELVAVAQLTAVSLTKSTSELHHSRLAEGDETLPIHTPSPKFKWAFSKTKNILRCGVRLEVTVGEDAASPLIELTGEYLLTYQLTKSLDLPPPVATRFAGTQAVFNAWSFFREFAHASVARMSMAPLMLPMMHLAPLPPK